jgi:FkbM family methyltransferase
MTYYYKYHKYKLKYLELLQNKMIGGGNSNKCILSGYGGINYYKKINVSDDYYVNMNIKEIIRLPNKIIDNNHNHYPYWKLQLPFIAWSIELSNVDEYLQDIKDKKTGKYNVTFKHGPNFFISSENTKLNPFDYEIPEQYLCYKWIKKTDIVLEIGARTGVVSCTINSLLNNGKNHVVIEPDKTVLHALQTNKKKVKASFNIETSAISNNPLYMIYSSNGIGNYVSEKLPDVSKNKIVKEINTITFVDLYKKYNLKFNVLVGDCEGCLCKFYDDEPDFFHQLDVIIFEMDRQDKVDYTKFISSITKTHKQIDSIWNGFQQAWIKKK